MDHRPRYLGTCLYTRLPRYLVHVDNHTQQHREWKEEPTGHGEMQPRPLCPPWHLGPRIANRCIFGFHRPTTLLDRYYPWRPSQGIPNSSAMVIVACRGRTFWFSRSNMSPEPWSSSPCPVIRFTILPKKRALSVAHNGGRWCEPSLKSSEVRTRQASGSALGMSCRLEGLEGGGRQDGQEDLRKILTRDRQQLTQKQINPPSPPKIHLALAVE